MWVADLSNHAGWRDGGSIRSGRIGASSSGRQREYNVMYVLCWSGRCSVKSIFISMIDQSKYNLEYEHSLT